MAFNGSGTFARLYNWVVDRDTSVPITASRMDNEMDGMATGLTTTITKDGQTTTTARIPFASGLGSGDGTVALPALNFTSDTDTGIYRIGTNNVGVAANGAKVVDIATTGVSVTGALSTSTTLGVTGATTLSSTLGVTGATTLSAALTYGGVTLSNAVTGTGNMVLSASPTFTGTNTVATLAATTINAFTLAGTVSGGGNQINNVIIGNTTPLAGSFTTLSASGIVSLTNATTASSTSSAGAVFTGGVGIGDNLRVANAGTFGSLIAASSGAIVKIYDTTAAHVGLYLSSASGIAHLNTTNNAGTYTGTVLSFTSGVVSCPITTAATSTTTGAFQCVGGGSFQDAFFVGGSGNFGSPSATQQIKLSWSDAADDFNYLTTQGGSLGLIIKTQASGTFKIQRNTTVDMTLSSAGAFRWHAYGAGTLTTDASGNITAVSDARLKDRVGDFTRSLIDLRKIGPASVYDYRPDSGLVGRGAGWMLVEGAGMVAAFPEAIGRSRDGFLTFADRPVLAACVNAVIDVDDKVQKLIRENVALRERVDQLQSSVH